MTRGDRPRTGRGPIDVAVDGLLDQPDLAFATRRSYRLTLAAIVRALPVESRLEPTTSDLTVAAFACWAHTAPATWNRHAAAVESFARYAAAEGVADWRAVELPRRRVRAD